jgi:gas vesicle protein
MHIITFIRGVTVGFIVGILLAPDSGAATRRKLARCAASIRDDIEDAIRELAHGGPPTSEATSKAEEIMDRNEPGYSNLTGYAGTL